MKRKGYNVRRLCCAVACAVLFCGCTAPKEEQSDQAGGAGEENSASVWTDAPTDALTDALTDVQEREGAAEPAAGIVPAGPKPRTIGADWSGYFDGLNGAAVLYDPSEQQYTVYGSELASTRRSPCSTFKIISSLVALENGIIDPEDSTRTWSGEIFWNEAWNRDIDLQDAFRASCVWYFREVVNLIGPEMMQEMLDGLQYGNCDISDWEGRLNSNNSNRALTGFWIESSLKISPKEQTQVMERIFGADTPFSQKTRDQLSQAMLVPAQADPLIYGKTGMGVAHGVTIDAWFTGYAVEPDAPQEKIYFCIYLGQTDGREVTSTAAKEIAIRIVSECAFAVTPTAPDQKGLTE